MPSYQDYVVPTSQHERLPSTFPRQRTTSDFAVRLALPLISSQALSTIISRRNTLPGRLVAREHDVRRHPRYRIWISDSKPVSSSASHPTFPPAPIHQRPNFSTSTNGPSPSNPVQTAGLPNSPSPSTNTHKSKSRYAKCIGQSKMPTPRCRTVHCRSI